ncbi:MAG: enoyl-CoA hydratase [Crocinitomicaceae bacterium]|jgi:enoyl-CoA hydratase
MENTTDYNYKNILVYPSYEPNIALIKLNRPRVHNALSLELMEELGDAIGNLEKEVEVRAVVITGSDISFSSGADLKEVMYKESIELLVLDQFKIWDQITKFKKPLIAAISGWCVGGGCEMAMLCDLIVASETAQFGQPEIRRGIGSGAGGTQRMPRAIGKARAMEMILTGEFIDAESALNLGLINRVYPVDSYLEGALEFARKIKKLPPLAVTLAKESVLHSYNSPLNEGLVFERKNYYLLFSSEDQKEGTRAFLDKRDAHYVGK